MAGPHTVAARKLLHNASRLQHYHNSMRIFTIQQQHQQHQQHQQQQWTLVRRHAGGYSCMLDMGGAPSSATSDPGQFRLADASKNCQIQAVCFDFGVITRAAATSDADDVVEEGAKEHLRAAATPVPQAVQPDVSAVEQFANLLNVDLGGGMSKRNKTSDDDDLSLLTGEASTTTPPKRSTAATKPAAPLSADIRSKYADKLKKRMGGGLSGIELAKQQAEDSLARGDAGGHLHARQIVQQMAASKDNTTNSPSGWWATSGSGRLLQYLTQRSVKIGLLPTLPSSGSNSDSTMEANQGERMGELTRQLKDVVFDVVLSPSVDDKSGSSAESPRHLVAEALAQLGGSSSDSNEGKHNSRYSPQVVMLVSDRDEYLRAAKDAGLVTCRLRQPNAPRGNTSTHYTVATVPEVEDVLNEVNGISFNAVLKR